MNLTGDEGVMTYIQDKWVARDVPSPLKLMDLTKDMPTSAQDMYYGMMGLEIEDFNRASAAVQAVEAVQKGGMGNILLDDSTEICDAIARGRLDKSFDRAVGSMMDMLSRVEKAMKGDDEEKEDEEPEEEPEEDKVSEEEESGDEDSDEEEDEDIDEDDSEEEIPEETVEIDAEVPPEAPVEAPSETPVASPPIDFGALFGGAPEPQQTAVDPELILRALKLLQSIGAMC